MNNNILNGHTAIKMAKNNIVGRRIKFSYIVLRPILKLKNNFIFVDIGQGPHTKHWITTDYLNLYDIMALYCKQLTLIDKYDLYESRNNDLDSDNFIMPNAKEMALQRISVDHQIRTFSYDCDTNVLSFDTH